LAKFQASFEEFEEEEGEQEVSLNEFMEEVEGPDDGELLVI